MNLWPRTRGAQARLLALIGILVVLAIVFRQPCEFIYSRAPVLYHTLAYTPQEGDVVFQSLPHNDLVDAIEGITHSPYSHCGVVLRNDKGQWVVIESIFTVHETPLFAWEFRGRGGAFDAYRLDPKYTPLIPDFKKALLTYQGLPYDYDYDMTQKKSVYCSSLAYLAFGKVSGEKMGQLQKLRDLDWHPFEQFIKYDQNGALPLDRIMITPASLAHAPQLTEVYRGGL